jgi:hypothetical protein
VTIKGFGGAGYFDIRLNGNLYYNPNSTFKNRKNFAADDVFQSVVGLSAWKDTCRTGTLSFIVDQDSNSVSGDPLFTNAPLYPVGYSPSWDFTPLAGSPALGNAVHLALAVGGGTGTSLTVDDGGYFIGDLTPVAFLGDSIKVGAAAAVRVTAVAGNVLTLSASRSWSDGDEVFLYRNGVVVNNIGASGGGGTPPGVTIPDTTTQVAPANGSAQTQPVTFRWRAVTGATKYWLSLSSDNWATEYDNATITDTFFVYSGLPFSTLCRWNMAVGNDAGWNQAAWANEWTFTTASAPVTGQTVTVDWNKVMAPVTLIADAEVVMANVQRLNTYMVMKNPSHYTVQWPSNVVWPGLTIAPAPSDAVTVYMFVQSEGVVYGFVLRNDWGGR